MSKLSPVGLRRSPMKRRPREGEVESFDLIAVRGEHNDCYRWPAQWMSEKEWQENILDYAYRGDQDIEYFHCRAPQTSRAGYFDLSIFQPNRKVGLLIELKVRDRHGKTKQASAAQKRFIAAALACGYDVRLWLYPDDMREAFETLTNYSFDAFNAGRLEHRGGE